MTDENLKKIIDNIRHYINPHNKVTYNPSSLHYYISNSEKIGFLNLYIKDIADIPKILKQFDIEISEDKVKEIVDTEADIYLNIHMGR